MPTPPEPPFDIRAFAEANARARREFLRSLTDERAIEILEALLEAQAQLAAEGYGPSGPGPLPTWWPARPEP